MIETFEKKIGENSYMITQLPARRALKLQAKLFKMIGPAIGAMISVDEKNSDSLKEMTPKALQMLADNIDDKTFDSLVLEILQGVRKNGSEITDKTIDLQFAGSLNELFMLIKEVVEVNFGDFFREGGILKDLTE